VEAVVNYGVPAVRKRGGGPTMLRIFLSSSTVFLFATVTINPLRPSPSRSATDSQSYLSRVKNFVCPPELWAPYKLLHWGPNPLSAPDC
jgi:hypothetical protein